MGEPRASAGPKVGLVRQWLLSRFPFKEEHVLPPEAATHPGPGPHSDSTRGPRAVGGLCSAGRRTPVTPVELTSEWGTREVCRHRRRQGWEEP